MQPFSGLKTLFFMGFLPFCVKPLAPLGLKAVGTVGTSDGKPVTARLSEGVCCSHSQFTKWEQWEHPSLCPLLLPCLPNAARKGAPRPLPGRARACIMLAPAKRGAESAPAPHLPASLAADPARPCGFPSPGCCTAHGGRLAACTGGPAGGRGWICTRSGRPAGRFDTA
jgi:hypothetical protein